MDQAEPHPVPGQPERPGRAERPVQRPGRAERPKRPSEHPERPEPERSEQARRDLEPPERDLEPSGDRRVCRDLDHPVVVGFDGSTSSRHALAYAAGMARRLGQSLLVVHVIPPAIYCEPLTGQVIGMVRNRDEIDRWLLAELELVCDPDGLDVSVATRRGNPARELAAVASERCADALIIGAPNHVWHHVAGSVPGWLARHAHCPVIVVP
jgi:nucleotide-binding universal stress UspA family protein